MYVLYYAMNRLSSRVPDSKMTNEELRLINYELMIAYTFLIVPVGVSERLCACMYAQAFRAFKLVEYRTGNIVQIEANKALWFDKKTKSAQE